VKVELISIVIPCYNEEATIEEFYRRSQSVADSLPQRRFEFIFVNDCSTDLTGSILNNLAAKNPSVKVLHLAQNRGHQIALTAGLDLALGDMIVTIDADLQDPPELIHEMTQRIEEGYDIIHAQRRQRKGETRFKLFSAWLFYRLMRWVSNTAIIENCGDFRAFTQPVRTVLSAFRAPHRFLRGTFVQLGFQQCVIQYDRDPRYGGQTKYPFLKMLNLSIDALLGFSASPIRIISLISICLWAFSLVYMVKSLIEHFIFKITVPGWTSMVVLLFFFTGLILFCIAIIGSYVGRIYIQGQNQPLYWLADARNFDPEALNRRQGQIPEIKISQRILQGRENDNL
jgi:glycosyltransferase involved in cell wall biosynthesis